MTVGMLCSTIVPSNVVYYILLHVLPGAFMLVQRPFGQFDPFPNPTSTKALALTAQPHPGYM